MAHIVTASSAKLSNSAPVFRGRNKITPSDILYCVDITEDQGVANEIPDKIQGPDEILKLNVGGTIFIVKRNNLEKRRHGILSNLRHSQECFQGNSGMYFFDRNPTYFCAILDFYRTGQVHVDGDFCGLQLEEELAYWGLSDDVIGDCCWRRYCDLREEQSQNSKVRREYLDVCEIKMSRLKGLPPWKERLWVTLEDPSYSTTAKAVLFTYLGIVLLSLVNACANSYIISSARQDFESQMISNVSAGEWFVSTISKRPGAKIPLFIEACCISVMFVFVLLRIYVCPMKWRFFTSVLNIFDLAYILSSGCDVAMMLYLYISDLVSEKWQSFGTVVKVFYHLSMIIGIFRIFRAARHYRGVRDLWYAIRASVREVWLLSIFVTIGIIIFGILFYCAQLSRGSDSYNIFAAFWWALITMTTVGYGDVVPTEVLTYLVAAICALVGLVMISLPIPVIAHNFSLYNGYKSRSCRKLDKSNSADDYK